MIGENEMFGLDGMGFYGLNIVIFLVYYGFNIYGYGEKECLFYVDNCVGIFY